MKLDERKGSHQTLSLFGDEGDAPGPLAPVTQTGNLKPNLAAETLNWQSGPVLESKRVIWPTAA